MKIIWLGQKKKMCIFKNKKFFFYRKYFLKCLVGVFLGVATTGMGGVEKQSPVLWGAVLTPLKPQDAAGESNKFKDECDIEKLQIHCQEMLDAGCDGLVLLGPTGQGTLFSTHEKVKIFTELADTGEINLDKIIVTAGGGAPIDAVYLMRQAYAKGYRHFLVLPVDYSGHQGSQSTLQMYRDILTPFKEKDISVYVYHGPEISGIFIDHDTLEQLLKEFPQCLKGIQDSSDDWQGYTQPLLKRFSDRLEVYVGAEHYLLQALHQGAKGGISDLSNIIPDDLRRYCDKELSLKEAVKLINKLQKMHNYLKYKPKIPILMSVVALTQQDPDWHQVRAPLLKCDKARVHEIKTFFLTDILGLTLDA